MRRLLLASGVTMALVAAAPVHPQPAPPNPIRYVAANCANCHGTLGRSSGAMPSLAGLQKPYFVEQMRLFRDGKRPATIMHQIAKGYSEEQIDALADFFARQAGK
jgi:cytochrome subunit of sulfide dehydrogenase